MSGLYIAWQQVAVKGRGGGGPLLADPELLGLGYAPPWRRLHCEHHGGGRAEWTPFVVRDERGDGLVRQQLIFRLAGLRTCCIADELRRAAWWHDVDWAVRLWGELGSGPLGAALTDARHDLIAELREVIRRPTPAGIRDFAAFRADHDAEDAARDAANRAFWDRQLQAAATDARAEPNFGGRSKRRPDVGEPPHFLAVLGLKPGATRGQIRARHRELVMRHHPDRGGEDARFRAVQDAYERALADLARRQPD